MTDSDSLRGDIHDPTRQHHPELRELDLLRALLRPRMTATGDASFPEALRGLIVELDGGQHVERAPYDSARTAWLSAQGLRVIRFWNDDVLVRTDDVLAAIWEALAPSPQPLSRKGRGA